jgi:hypothetical protein
MRRRDFVTATLLTLPLTSTRTRAASSPVVLELFTSQGCSSCPPADALLGELTRHPGIIGLAWHVDYWNSLGWRDPYARREWTDRQRSYAKFLDAEVYTPALVVNGAAMVVGSDADAVRKAIGQGAGVSPAVPPVAVTLRRTDTGLEAGVGDTAIHAVGMLATYDPQQTTRVGAGENQGRQLVEFRVVREAVTLDKLSPKFALPSIPANRGAVLLIQDASWRIIGAADLPPSEGV